MSVHLNIYDATTGSCTYVQYAEKLVTEKGMSHLLNNLWKQAKVRLKPEHYSSTLNKEGKVVYGAILNDKTIAETLEFAESVLGVHQCIVESNNKILYNGPIDAVPAEYANMHDKLYQRYADSVRFII